MPDKYVVSKNKLDALATSISIKSGVQVPMTLAQMKTVVDEMGSTPEVTISTSGSVTQELQPNTVYHFTSTALTNLTITLASASGTPTYHFDFISPSTAVTLVLPSSVLMPTNFTVEVNTRYEIDICNGHGVFAEWAYQEVN